MSRYCVMCGKKLDDLEGDICHECLAYADDTGDGDI